MLSTISFQKLFDIQSKFAGTLLAFDPGETTGICVFKGSGLAYHDQIKTLTPEERLTNLNWAFEMAQPTHVVYENYRVYGDKAKDHTNQELITPRVIGTIEDQCTLRKIPHANQMASLAKGFVTDDKLRAWKFWHEGQKHARDATRHAIYYLLFTYPRLIKEGKLK